MDKNVLYTVITSVVGFLLLVSITMCSDSGRIKYYVENGYEQCIKVLPKGGYKTYWVKVGTCNEKKKEEK